MALLLDLADLFDSFDGERICEKIPAGFSVLFGLVKISSADSCDVIWGLLGLSFNASSFA